MDISLKALEEAVSIRRQIQTLEKRLASLFGGGKASRSTSGSGKRRVSAATRAKLKAAAKARWARQRGGKSATRSKKKGSGLTAAGRRKLSQMMKARWAARRRASGRK